MSLVRYLMLGLGFVALAGCQGARYELLERDLRWQEDEIFALQDELDGLQGQLEAARQENAALRRELGDREPGDRAHESPAEQTFSAPSIDLGQPTPRSPLPSGESEIPPFEGPPVIDPLPPDATEPAPHEHAVPEPSANEPLPVPDEVSSSSSPVEAADEQPRDYRIEQITLNRLLTGGYNTNGHLGDEGLLLLIEPRNHEGQVINVPGDVQVVLLDPALEGEAARLARWDLPADMVAREFRDQPTGRGVRLELPWPGQAPAHSDLRLFVRFIAADGKRYTAEKSVHVELAGTPAWTPAAGGAPVEITRAPRGDGATIEWPAETASPRAPGTPRTSSTASPGRLGRGRLLRRR